MDPLAPPAHPSDAPSVRAVLRPDKLVCFEPELVILLKEATNTRDKGKHGLQQRRDHGHMSFTTILKY